MELDDLYRSIYSRLLKNANDYMRNNELTRVREVQPATWQINTAR